MYETPFSCINSFDIYGPPKVSPISILMVPKLQTLQTSLRDNFALLHDALRDSVGSDNIQGGPMFDTMQLHQAKQNDVNSAISTLIAEGNVSITFHNIFRTTTLDVFRGQSGAFMKITQTLIDSAKKRKKPDKKNVSKAVETLKELEKTFDEIDGHFV
ncbi:unnamed protein product [Rhizophagus irregularis]|uniref:Uncharacterized protein n=1 Tax=Rhizophagus irregularis TaxID=588596 RepID=A0A915ZMJ1_9GLOM|nr:unnamed protein product [Rhizophagus irregularis]